MKKRVVSLCICFILSMTLLCAQEVPNGLVTAFQQGNAESIQDYLGGQVELIIQKGSVSMDRKRAGGKLAEFFSTNKVCDFRVNHQGRRDESGFIVGTLITANGDYRVNCFFKKVGNKFVIHQIRIDK